MSGLVCLLPHGYEGQGSGAFVGPLERYLQLCAEDNMQVANCDAGELFPHPAPAAHRDIRKPLILMTPKSLLRHKRCVSSSTSWRARASFHRISCGTTPRALWAKKIKLVKGRQDPRVVLCSGKVYYDLYEGARSAASTTSICCASSSSIRSR